MFRYKPHARAQIHTHIFYTHIHNIWRRHFEPLCTNYYLKNTIWHCVQHIWQYNIHDFNGRFITSRHSKRKIFDSNETICNCSNEFILNETFTYSSFSFKIRQKLIWNSISILARTDGEKTRKFPNQYQ